MKAVFNKIYAECEVCGTKVDGRYSRNDKFYCASHFETTSAAEKVNNDLINRKKRNYDKIYK